MNFLVQAAPALITAAIVIVVFFLLGYVKAPPDVAYIISGLRRHPKVLIGRAGVKIPFFERVDKLRSRSTSSPRATSPRRTLSAWMWTRLPRCAS